MAGRWEGRRGHSKKASLACFSQPLPRPQGLLSPGCLPLQEGPMSPASHPVQG